MLAEVRELCLCQRYPMSELPINDLNVAVERAKHGDDRDGAIRTMRESVEAVFARHQVGYAIHSGCELVEALLQRGGEADIAEAAAVITRMMGLPAEGSAIRDVRLIRLQALFSRARGDDAGYRDLRDRYRAMATSLGFEGHIAMAEAMR